MTLFVQGLGFPKIIGPSTLNPKHLLGNTGVHRAVAGIQGFRVSRNSSFGGLSMIRMILCQQTLRSGTPPHILQRTFFPFRSLARLTKHRSFIAQPRKACHPQEQQNGSFPKLGVPFLGAPIMRTIVYSGPLILGNYQIKLHPREFHTLRMQDSLSN